jgi:subtilisin-like proprotein convertase family protein
MVKKSSYSSVGSPLWVSAPGGEYGWHTSYGGSKTGVELEPAIMTTDLASCSKGYVSASGGAKNNAFNDYDSPHAENSSCNYVNTFNGTSSAAPNVSGVIALMLEANPSLTWRDVKHILATTANQVDSDISPISVDGIAYHSWVENYAGYKFHPYYGFGGVDATAAVNASAEYAAGSLGTYQTALVSSNAIDSAVSEGSAYSTAIDVTASGAVEFIRVAIRMSHGLPASMGMRLESPSGTFTTILQPYSAVYTNPNNSYIYLAANAFYGESMTGKWTLWLYDHYIDSNVMTLGDWSLTFKFR